METIRKPVNNGAEIVCMRDRRTRAMANGVNSSAAAVLYQPMLTSGQMQPGCFGARKAMKSR